MILTCLAIFTLMNFWAFVQFGRDKTRAESGKSRIPEAELLQLAMFGGIFGAYLGRSYFQHKTRKVSFSNRLHLIAMVQAGVAAGVVWTFMTSG